MTPSPFRFTGCAAILIAFTASVSALTVDPGGPVKTGVFSCPAIVEGRPAVVWSDDQLSAVKYARALDDTGASWGVPVTVVSGPQAGGKVSLVIANGNPAVSYYDFARQELKFVRARDSTGSLWGTPVRADTGTGTGTFQYSMAVVDGKPAVCFVRTGGGKLTYVRSADAGGTVWQDFKFIDSAGQSSEPVLKPVQNRPAIACIDTENKILKYARASDAGGAAWDTRVNISTLIDGDIPHDLSLQIVNGRPALSFINFAGRNLMSVRARDAIGTAWDGTFFVNPEETHCQSPSLAIIGGQPALGYCRLSTSFDLKCVQAANIDGTAWRPAMTVTGTGEAGSACSLFEVMGRPAFVYHDAAQGSLQYLRAAGTTANGVSQWPPDIAVKSSNFPETTFPDDGVMDFGEAKNGQAVVLLLRIVNPHSGSIPLTGIALTIDGPDAAEFSISAAPEATVAGGAATGFSLKFLPVAAGVKTSTLHIASSMEGPLNPYEITLTGSATPDIAVDRDASFNLEDAAIIDLPLPVAGVTTEFVFTIRNTGGAELNTVSITVDGPDAVEFTLSAPPAPVVAPGGRTSFILRHAPLTGGQKTVALHIASNVPGTKNPFDLTLRMLPGKPDPSFKAGTDSALDIAVGSNGRILTAGPGLTALHPDGSLDNSFFSPPLVGTVKCIAMQKDGAFLFGGIFSHAGGRARPGLARVFADGTLDESFAAGPNTMANDGVYCIKLQPDGKILAGGRFMLAGSSLWTGLARFAPDGRPDAGFKLSPNDFVGALVPRPGGGILVAGNLRLIPPGTAPAIALLNADGTLGAFSTRFDRDAECLAVQRDGGILAGGEFIGHMARLLPGGARDPSMTLTADSAVSDLALQADGKCIVAGDFTEFGGVAHHGLARINADGSLDDSFNPDPGGSVQRAILQADGKIIIAGDFPKKDSVERFRLARLINDPAFSSLTREGHSAVRWMRGGSAPEVSSVSFEVRTPEAPEWVILGEGTRIPGGWERTGLTLPASAQIRAFGRAGGSLMQEITPFLTSSPTPLESWRLQYFHTSENSGDAADDADPDRDGLTNFTEYAFGLSPVDRGSGSLPPFVHTGNAFSSSFTTPEGTENILYRAEWSPSMLPGTWTAVADTGTEPAHAFSISGSAERLFVRYTVRMK